MEQITRKEWDKLILLVFVIIVMIQSFTLCKVEGKSMQPTLQEEDYVFVNKVAAHFPPLQHGEIVVIKNADDSKYYVKRVIGLPGETIKMENGTLYVNDKEQDEQYINRELFHKSEVFLEYKKTRIPPNNFFVMGDNRSHSKDSWNGLGYIDQSSVIGKVEFVYYPFSKAKILE